MLRPFFVSLGFSLCFVAVLQSGTGLWAVCDFETTPNCGYGCHAATGSEMCAECRHQRDPAKSKVNGGYGAKANFSCGDYYEQVGTPGGSCANCGSDSTSQCGLAQLTSC